jgi:hypothetical protein
MMGSGRVRSTIPVLAATLAIILISVISILEIESARNAVFMV